MTRLSRSAVRERLDGLGPAERAAFVAAVYDARGWGTERVDGAVLATPPDAAEPRRIVASPPSGARPTRDAGTDVLDAGDICELLTYALTDADRTALVRRFFDCDPADLSADEPNLDGRTGEGATADSPADRERGRGRGGTARRAPKATPGDTATPDADGSADRRGAAAVGAGGDGNGNGNGNGNEEGGGPGSKRWLAAALVAALVVAAGVAAVGPTLGSPFGDGTDPAEAGGNETTPPAGVVDPAGAAHADGDDPGRASLDERLPAPGADPVSDGDPFPPGVDAAGVVDARDLAAAHGNALSNRSYRLSVDYREYVGGRPTGRVHERTVVAGPTRYRTDLTAVGRLRGEPWMTANATTYADGETEYTRLTNETYADGTVAFDGSATEAESAGGEGWRSVNPTADRDRFARRTTAYLAWLLDESDTTVVGSFDRDGRTQFWIAVQPESAAGTDAVGSLLVDEGGLVRSMHYEYTYVPADSSSVRVVVHVDLTPANVTVSRPAWVRRGGE